MLFWVSIHLSNTLTYEQKKRIEKKKLLQKSASGTVTELGCAIFFHNDFIYYKERKPKQCEYQREFKNQNPNCAVLLIWSPLSYFPDYFLGKYWNKLMLMLSKATIRKNSFSCAIQISLIHILYCGICLLLRCVTFRKVQHCTMWWHQSDG